MNYDKKNPDSLTIDSLVIVGGGTMGQGIAQAAARRGIDVLIVERDKASISKAMNELNEKLDREIARWAMTDSEKKTILSRIKGEVGFKSITDQPFVLEAVSEDFELKKEIFVELCSQCSEDTIFITNTSTLSITELANITNRPDKVIGMHFMNPVQKVKLVELVRGLMTSAETFHRTKTLAERLDRTTIEVFESPGYVTTRVIMPMVNEAIQVLMEGIASAEDIDKAMQMGYEFSNGPLKMADQIGLDLVLGWLNTLFREVGETKYRPCPLLKMLVRAGYLGVKTGRGIFKYEDDGTRIPGSGHVSASFDRFFHQD